MAHSNVTVADTVAGQRMNHLWTAANAIFDQNADLARQYLRSMKQMAATHGIDIPEAVAVSICSRCCSLLVPGCNSRGRIHVSRQRRIPRVGFSVDVGKTSAEGVTKAAKEARKEANREPEKKDRKRLWQMRRRRGRGARLSILCEICDGVTHSARSTSTTKQLESTPGRSEPQEQPKKKKIKTRKVGSAGMAAKPVVDDTPNESSLDYWIQIGKGGKGKGKGKVKGKGKAMEKAALSSFLGNLL